MGILDLRPLPLQDPDAKELLKVVLEVYFKVDRIEVFAQSAGVNMAAIAWQNSAEDIWPELLTEASMAGRLRALVQLVADHPSSAAYRSLFERLLAAATPAAGGIAPHLLPLVGHGRRPFIDRDDLRSRVMDLLTGTSRVLVVNGPERSGKSYSWYLISHLADRLGSFTPYPVDLSSWAGPPAGPVDVMREIVSLLRLTMPAYDSSAQEDTLARTLSTWFVGQIRPETKPCWLVFDGLNASTTTDAALRLIESIAVAAERAAAGELRVILIAHARPLPDEIDPYALRDTTAFLGEAHLRAFFSKVAEAAGQQVDEAGLDLLVGRLLGPGPPPNPLPARVLVDAGALARAAFPLLPAGGGGG